MRGFIVASRNKDEGDELDVGTLGIALSKILDDLPEVRFMSDLSRAELKRILS